MKLKVREEVLGLYLFFLKSKGMARMAHWDLTVTQRSHKESSTGVVEGAWRAQDLYILLQSRLVQHSTMELCLG